MAADLILRDIHTPVGPSWWPPAPGWWLLLATLFAIVAVVVFLRRRHVRRRERLRALFDETVAAAVDPPARVAAISELLRRAARRRAPDAERLQGEAWLAFLDGEAPSRRKAEPHDVFSSGPGRLLLDGGFRRTLASAEVEALQVVARARFIEWMLAR